MFVIELAVTLVAGTIGGTWLVHVLRWEAIVLILAGVVIVLGIPPIDRSVEAATGIGLAMGLLVAVSAGTGSASKTEQH